MSHLGDGRLLDWELAAFADPLSDLARLAVRLRHPDVAQVMSIAEATERTAAYRAELYWHIHLLADAALATDASVRAHARTMLS
jgi:aminoglycoside phosphotransferase (APT) family kinase protein